MANRKVLGLAMSALLLMKGMAAEAGEAMAALESAASAGGFAVGSWGLEDSKKFSSQDFEGLRDSPAAVPIGGGRSTKTYAATHRTKVPPVPKPVVVAAEQKAAAPPPPPPAHPGATRGAAFGMVMGFLIGLLLGPIGALVGALIGAVIGAALGRMTRK